MTTKFLIQTENMQIVHDFSFHLIEAIKYNNWYYDEKKYDYIICNNFINDVHVINIEDYIPVGSVEFVLGFLKEYHNIDNVKPINMPNELNKIEFTKRNIWDCTEEFIKTFNSYNNNIVFSKPVFIKSSDKVKGFTNIITDKVSILNGNYLISDLIDIESEWRAFIYKGQLVGLKNYSGEFTIMPSIALIYDMIRDYKNCPTAYTLDVGMNYKDGTFVIEVHNFFSCGLYGFADYRILPNMFIDSFKDLLK